MWVNWRLELIEVEYYIWNEQRNKPYIISNLIIFSLFDGYLDIENDALVGLSFKGKYDKSNHSSDIEIMIKETYRILRLIRNEVVHNVTGIIIKSIDTRHLI